MSSTKVCLAKECLSNTSADGSDFCVDHRCYLWACDNPSLHATTKRISRFCLDHACVELACMKAKRERKKRCNDHTCSESDCDTVKSPEKKWCPKHTCPDEKCNENNECIKHVCARRILVTEGWGNKTVTCFYLKLPGFELCKFHKCQEEKCKGKKKDSSEWCYDHGCRYSELRSDIGFARFTWTCEDRAMVLRGACEKHKCITEGCTAPYLGSTTPGCVMHWCKECSTLKKDGRCKCPIKGEWYCMVCGVAGDMGLCKKHREEYIEKGKSVVILDLGSRTTTFIPDTKE